MTGLHADTKPSRASGLATGVALLLVLTVLQRGVGFLRGILFCRWLDEEQLGQWDMALGFLAMAAPIVALGIPGSFGKFVEGFRARGQLRGFLRRVTKTCGLLGIAGVAGLLVLNAHLREWVFAGSAKQSLLLAVAAALVGTIVFNFLTSLCTALSLYRTLSITQFMNSVGFAVISIVAILLMGADATTIVIAYGLACCLSSTIAFVGLRQAWTELPPDDSAASATDTWRRILPFAIWVWTTNCLANFFDATDRYMLLHHSGLDAASALGQVGQYHSSRILPALLISVAEMLAAVVLPHLSREWEAANKPAVTARMNFMLKLAGLGFTVVAAAILLGSDVLFGSAFLHKYEAGCAVLPWSLTYSLWFSLAILAQNYLWCADGARLVTFNLCLGLTVNVIANYLLVPKLALHGAVIATSAAHAISLCSLCLISWRHGMRFDRATLAMLALPGCIALGKAGAVVGTLLALGFALRGRVFTAAERRQLQEILHSIAHRLLPKHKRSERSSFSG